MDPIQKHFNDHPLPKPKGACLDEAQLVGLARGSAGVTQRERWLEHASSCEACTEKLALLKQLDADPAADKEPAAALSKRTASLTGKKPPRAIEPYLWFAAFAAFMTLSFTWKRYFAQMLVLAAVCAVKWLLETRARRVYVDVTHHGGGPAGTGGAGGGRLKGDLHEQDGTGRD